MKRDIEVNKDVEVVTRDVVVLHKITDIIQDDLRDTKVYDVWVGHVKGMVIPIHHNLSQILDQVRRESRVEIPEDTRITASVSDSSSTLVGDAHSEPAGIVTAAVHGTEEGEVEITVLACANCK